MSKHKHPAIVAFLFAAALFCEEALAITLSLTPSSQMIDPALGEKALIDLEISGLGEDGSPTLGAFGVEITFSPSILSFESVDYDTFLGDPNNPAETDVQTSAGPASVTLDEFSFLSTGQLNQLQSTSFLMATLTFAGKESGTSPLDFKFIDLSDTLGNTLALDSIKKATINVAPIPLPATFGLFSAATGLLIGWRRRLF
jgi:hypothetical protein